MEKQTEPYIHKVQYYETDKMGIVHHSNYLRWFEEARTDMLEKIGMGYDVIEEKGVIIPVLSASCKYKKPVEYGNTVTVSVKLTDYNGVKFKMVYKICSSSSNILHAEGETEHCFLNKCFKPVNIKKYNKEIALILENYITV